MNADNTCPDSLSEKVLGAVFEVSNTLGVGFLEKVYQRALLRELSLRGIRAIAEASLSVIYKGHSVGEYFADLLVEDAQYHSGYDCEYATQSPSPSETRSSGSKPNSSSRAQDLRPVVPHRHREQPAAIPPDRIHQAAFLVARAQPC